MRCDCPAPTGAATPKDRWTHGTGKRPPLFPLKPLTSQNAQPARMLYPLDKFTQH